MQVVDDTASPESLEGLLKIRDRLFDRDVVEGLRQCGQAERELFVAHRMKLCEEILRLETAQLSTLRQALEVHGAELSRSTQGLTESLSEMEESARWAEGIGKLLSVVSVVTAAL